MVDNFKSLITSFILLGLFFVCFISWAAITAINNNATQSILDDETLNSTFQAMRMNLSAVDNIASGQRENFEGEVPESPQGSFLLVSIIGAGKVFSSVTVGFYNIMITLPSRLLGLDAIIIGAINTLLIITIILLAWGLYKIGK